MRRLPFELATLLIASPIALALSQAPSGTSQAVFGNDYEDECVEESCGESELEEMYSSYSSECISETCSSEEVDELAGTSSNVNAMLSTFLSAGWTIQSANISSSVPANAVWLFSSTNYGGLLFQASGNLSALGTFDDLTRSIKLGSSVTSVAYTDSSYGGDPLGVYGNLATLPSADDSAVSSLKVYPKAAISVTPLPSSVYLQRLDQTVSGLQGYTAQLRLSGASIVVPNFYDFGSCATKAINGTRVHDPLYTLSEWQDWMPTQLKINANFFQIFDGCSPPCTPYNMVCSNINGLSVSNSQSVSSASTPDFGNLLDSILFLNTGQAVIVSNSEIAGYTGIQNAVSGAIIVREGRILPNNAILSSAKPTASGSRTAVGLDKGGSTLTIVVIQTGSRNPGMTAKQLGAYMIQQFNCDSVLNLDNSGSSQFLYAGSAGVLTTIAGDSSGCGTSSCYRPIPNFLGIQ